MTAAPDPLRDDLAVELHILRHALGVAGKRRSSWGYRNRYIAEPNTHLEHLVEAEYMVVAGSGPGKLWTYQATRRGAQRAGMTDEEIDMSGCIPDSRDCAKCGGRGTVPAAAEVIEALNRQGEGLVAGAGGVILAAMSSRPCLECKATREESRLELRERIAAVVSHAMLDRMAGTLPPSVKTQGDFSRHIADAVLALMRGGVAGG